MANTAYIGPTVKVGKVLSIKDEAGGDRIQVKLYPENYATEDSEIKFAFPLMPKMIHIKPKVGEFVLVLTSKAGDANSRRYYIGPVTPQVVDLFYSGDYRALSMLDGAFTSPNTNPELNPKSQGALPLDSDVTILGRKNCDIQVKDNEVRINAGVKKLVHGDEGNALEFNDDGTHAFIKLKYNENGEIPDSSSKYNSTATIVADKINLIGNRSKKENSNFDTHDRADLLTDDELKKVMEKAHCLPYGDVLCDVLTTFYECFKNHTHPWAMEPPCFDEQMNNLDSEIRSIDENMLSDNVRIN